MNMRVGRDLLLVTMLIFGLVGASDAAARASTPAGAQDAAVAEAVLALTRDYVGAWERLDQEAILGFHGDDIQYYWMGTGTVTSNAAFAGLLAKMLPTLRSWSMTLHDPRVRVLGPDAAVVSFLFDFELVGTGGKRDSGTQAATYVFERRDRQWKIVLIHESAPVSGTQGATAIHDDAH